MLIILFVLFIFIAYYYIKSHYKYWERKSVPGPKPTFILGNIGQALLLKKSLGELVTDYYKEYSNVPFVGIFRANTPTLIVRDTELIRDITVKEFNSFHDNEIDIDEEKDPLFGKSPFVLKGEKWKVVRTQLTPCFTSGKMKAVYPLLENMSKRLVKFIEDQPDLTNGSGLEAKELCTKFTLNNVASCAFGLEGKCFEDPNSEFRELARKFLTPSGIINFILLLAMIFPIIFKLFKVKVTPADVEKKLIQIVSETLRYREENNIQRNDFLQILSQLRKTSKEYEFTDLDITAHSAGFFVDGYETSSVVMSFLLFELAANPDKQAKLREEIKSKMVNDTISYEDLHSLEYLDAAFNESLRLHPAIIFLTKRCTKSFTINNENIDKPVVIEKDTSIIIPTMGLHTDPKYFEDSETYIPERFLSENRHRIPKYVFMPFGEGPRACLGQRFGILQVKMGVAYIIKNFELSVNDKTQIPLKYDPVSFLLAPIGGLWINYKKI